MHILLDHKLLGHVGGGKWPGDEAKTMPLFGMPSLHLFTFLMFFIFLFLYFLGVNLRLQLDTQEEYSFQVYAAVTSGPRT